MGSGFSYAGYAAVAVCTAIATAAVLKARDCCHKTWMDEYERTHPHCVVHRDRMPTKEYSSSSFIPSKIETVLFVGL
jgi:hypothetical protein